MTDAHRPAPRRVAGVGSRVRSTAQRAGHRFGDVRRGTGSGDDGFTLIEAIVSFTIFIIVSAAAVLALLTGIKGNNDTTDRVTASQLAQQATDQARAMPKPALTASPSVTTQQVVGNKTYSVTRIVSYPAASCLPASATIAPGDEQVRKIAVRVVVTAPGGSGRVVRMDSVIAC